MVSDFGHPRTRGGGGVKKGQMFADVLYGWPLNSDPHVRIILAELVHTTLRDKYYLACRSMT